MSVQSSRSSKLRKAVTLIWGICLFLLIMPAIGLAQWTQFGGPNRDFTLEGGPLNTNWGEDGPKVLWSREFGDGFASLLVDEGVVYGAHRDGDKDVYCGHGCGHRQRDLGDFL